MVASVGTSSANVPVSSWHKPPSFSELDTNGDGSLSPAELKRAGKVLNEVSGGAAAPTPALFKEIDSNGDGTISQREFSAFESLSAPTRSLVLQQQEDDPPSAGAQWVSGQYGAASALGGNPPGGGIALAA
jgi:EF-hand domain pair